MVTPVVMVVELFPADLIGTASGVVNTFCFVGSLLIPVLVGKIRREWQLPGGLYRVPDLRGSGARERRLHP